MVVGSVGLEAGPIGAPGGLSDPPVAPCLTHPYPVLCAVFEPVLCVVSEPVLCVVLELVLCVVLERVLCVVSEPRVRFASPARFALS